MNDPLDQSDRTSAIADDAAAEQDACAAIERDLERFEKMWPIYQRHGFSRVEAIIHDGCDNLWRRLVKIEAGVIRQVELMEDDDYPWQP